MRSMRDGRYFHPGRQSQYPTGAFWSGDCRTSLAATNSSMSVWRIETGPADLVRLRVVRVAERHVPRRCLDRAQASAVTARSRTGFLGPTYLVPQSASVGLPRQ